MEVSGINRRKFKLSSQFMSRYEGQQPEWGPLGYVIYKRTYARFLGGETDVTEEFWQTLQRVVEGTFNLQKFHCVKHNIPWDTTKAQKNAQRMFEKMWTFRFLPSGRGLWLMGTDFVYKYGSAGLNACAFVTTESLVEFPTDPFVWAMKVSMLGIGVGFDVDGQGMLTIREPLDTVPVVIEDSRDGWTDSVDSLLKAYFVGDPLPVFDYSNIREAGTRLKTFGGVSSGSEPLVSLHRGLVDLLKGRSGDTVSSGDIVDVFTLIAKCVVSGNIRRSAMIALGKAEDEEFLSLKGDSEKLLNNRWASNNSVKATVGQDYSGIVERIQANGEPGIIWLDTIQQYGRLADPRNDLDRRARGVNPCSEQTLEPDELCNLVETFPSLHESYEEYQETLKYATMYAKSVTLLDTPWPRTNAVMRRNRRMGISQSGVIDAFNHHGKATIRGWCDRGYRYVKESDRKLSDYLCVRESIKVTSVKPSGTTSLLPGVSPGIHYPHSRFYIRRVRFASNSKMLPMLEQAGYPIEPDAYSDNTVVVSFPVEAPHFRKGKKDVTMWQQLENAAMYQKYWADNQVSITVHFSEAERDQVQEALEYFDDRLKCVSFLPLKDHGYVQPPYEEITEEVFNSMTMGLIPMDYSSLCGDGAAGEKYCSSDSCTIL